MFLDVELRVSAQIAKHVAQWRSGKESLALQLFSFKAPGRPSHEQEDLMFGKS